MWACAVISFWPASLVPISSRLLFFLILNRKLWIKVLDQDIGKDDSLGKACVDIEKLKPTSTPSVLDVRVDNNVFKRDAVMWLKISYVD